ncbi:MAG: hypothetical protein ABIS86_03180 [Streptosporangiaceae bacterium]
MRKTIWMVPAVAALVTAVGVAPAHAATQTQNRPMTPYTDSNTLISTIPQNSSSGWHVGDCYQNPGYLFLDRPVGSPSIGRLRWAYTTYTTHTSNFDQWHLTWTFRTASGAQVLRVGPVDSVRMTTVGREYTQEFTADVFMTPAVFNGIRSVDWSGSC